MGLDDLVQAVERVRETARKHQGFLSQSEALTRYCLIDPLLRALGWDTADPEQVRVEESAGGGKADYVLLNSDGGILFLIEAKKATQKLPPIATTEVIKYAGLLLHSGKPVEQLVISNGLLWEFYEYPSLVQRGKIALGDTTRRPEEAALELARMLWSPLVRTPVSPTVTSSVTKAVSLSDFVKQAQGGSKPPMRLMFPDGSSTPIVKWNQLLVEVARYLLRLGVLEQRVPVQWGKRYLVARTPHHPGGIPFKNPRSVDSIYVETHYPSWRCVEGAIKLISICGQHPAVYKVQL